MKKNSQLSDLLCNGTPEQKEILNSKLAQKIIRTGELTISDFTFCSHAEYHSTPDEDHIWLPYPTDLYTEIALHLMGEPSVEEQDRFFAFIKSANENHKATSLMALYEAHHSTSFEEKIFSEITKLKQLFPEIERKLLVLLLKNPLELKKVYEFRLQIADLSDSWNINLLDKLDPEDEIQDQIGIKIATSCERQEIWKVAALFMSKRKNASGNISNDEIAQKMCWSIKFAPENVKDLYVYADATLTPGLETKTRLKIINHNMRADHNEEDFVKLLCQMGLYYRNYSDLIWCCQNRMTLNLDEIAPKDTLLEFAFHLLMQEVEQYHPQIEFLTERIIMILENRGHHIKNGSAEKIASFLKTLVHSSDFAQQGEQLAALFVKKSCSLSPKTFAIWYSFLPEFVESIRYKMNRLEAISSLLIIQESDYPEEVKKIAYSELIRVIKLYSLDFENEICLKLLSHGMNHLEGGPANINTLLGEMLQQQKSAEEFVANF